MQCIKGMESSVFERLLKGEEYDPHTVLGLHRISESRQRIVIWRPGAQDLLVELKGKVRPMEQVHSSGLFQLEVSGSIKASDYRVFHQSGLLARDPYTYLPTIGEVDLHLLGRGCHYDLYRVLGAHPMQYEGTAGVRFAVWAPTARRVSVVADHNHWNGLVAPMRALGSSGVWELFIPGIEVGEKYKFEIKTCYGELRVKSDPYAHQFELRPKTAGVVMDPSAYRWRDDEWMKERQAGTLQRPMSIYEVHLGSWKRREGHWMSYVDLAHELSRYCHELGFTHVELLPIAEHPFDQSWGYQVSGYYAPTSRFGTLADFQYFVDHLHREGIGVILDWVPGHFPADDFALARFDGTCLYEHQDPRQGRHPHWDTLIFNFGRPEVSNFLIANALFWLREMHIDGLRVDAVASMLYLDYGRESNEWVPNQHGGKENLEAIEFLKHLNAVVHERVPGVLMIAEESTSYTGVTHSQGLGFDLKWNMGWMNDTLCYFDKDALYRCYHQSDLTFGLLYAFSERFALVLSHDEVVHGKRSLLSKMPGDAWQKFANLRLLLSYMTCQPGKQLLFMGGELGQWNEWNCEHQLNWELLEYPMHQGLQRCVKELNHFYREQAAFWEADFDWCGFEWVDFNDTVNSVISYLRKGGGRELLCVHHFTPSYLEEYFITLPGVMTAQEVFNSDAKEYGGSGKQNNVIAISQEGISICMPPLATVVIAIEREQ